jgi:hypothetical protein
LGLLRLRGRRLLSGGSPALGEDADLENEWTNDHFVHRPDFTSVDPMPIHVQANGRASILNSGLPILEIKESVFGGDSAVV